MPGARSGWSRPLTLKDGAVLVTLNDARTLIQQRFAHVIEWQGATRAFMAAAEPGEQQGLQIEHNMMSCVGDVIDRKWQQRVERLRHYANSDAEHREQDHGEPHVPRGLAGAQAGILLEENEPGKFDARMQEDPRRRRHQQIPDDRQCSMPAASEIIDFDTKPDVSGNEEIESAPMMPQVAVSGMVRNNPPRSVHLCLPVM